MLKENKYSRVVSRPHEVPNTITVTLLGPVAWSSMGALLPLNS